MKGIVADTDTRVRDEAPQAYKDISQVGAFVPAACFSTTGDAARLPLSLRRAVGRSFWVTNESGLGESCLYLLQCE